MKTVLFGKVIENTYNIYFQHKSIKGENGKEKIIFDNEPEIEKEIKVKEWIELCSYKGEPRFNNFSNYFIPNGYHGFLIPKMNISENETVNIDNEIFRADLNEMHLYTNKIIEEIDINKEEVLAEYEKEIRLFNKTMIESNCKLKSYCDLHKLSYEDTNCIELFKLLFPDKKYQIKDNSLMPKERENTIYKDAIYIADNTNYNSATITILDNKIK